MKGRAMHGQMWSFDLALSLVIFLTAAIAMFAAWGNMTASISQTRAIEGAELRALTVSDSLMRTPGVPADWNESSASIIGLSLSEGYLDPGKVHEFSIMDHDRARVLTGIAPYDFHFELSDINGTVYESSGITAPDNATVVIPVQRHSIYNGRISRMTLVVWG